MNTKNFRLGCIPSIKSITDFTFKVEAPIPLPPKVDLFPMPKITNQGSLGSCTGHGTARAFERRLLNEGLPVWNPSRLMIYYGARELEGTIAIDAGAQIRSAVKTVAKMGVAEEHFWPYKIPKFTTKPSAAAYTDAKNKNHQALIYRQVSNSLRDIKTALVKGNAVIIGFAVYESFYTILEDGRMPLPLPGEALLGGHCVTIEGYDDARQRFICGNSWGTSWGDKGHFYMHYSFATDPRCVFEMWVIEDV